MSDSLQEFADRCGPDAEGMVYLLHFNRPIGDLSNPRGRAQHYLGWTTNLEGRLKARAGGNGHARILEVLAERGIGFTLVRTWAGPQSLERKLKRQHNSPRFCYICNPALNELGSEPHQGS